MFITASASFSSYSLLFFFVYLRIYIFLSHLLKFMLVSSIVYICVFIVFKGHVINPRALICFFGCIVDFFAFASSSFYDYLLHFF